MPEDIQDGSMRESATRDITDSSGRRFRAEVRELEVGYELRLEDGPTVQVPAALLEPTAEGEYLLREPLATLSAAGHDQDEQVIQLAEERLLVNKRQVTRGRVIVRKQVFTHEAVVDEPLEQEQVDVTRVPVGALVEAAEGPRTEGDTTIIPLYEEVLVVEKRLLLTEELHVTKRRSERRDPQQVTLRREEVSVERQDAGEQDLGENIG